MNIIGMDKSRAGIEPGVSHTAAWGVLPIVISVDSQSPFHEAAVKSL